MMPSTDTPLDLHALSGTAAMSHVLTPGEIDVSHGTILYVEDVTSASTVSAHSTIFRYRWTPASCAA